MRRTSSEFCFCSVPCHTFLLSEVGCGLIIPYVRIPLDAHCLTSLAPSFVSCGKSAACATGALFLWNRRRRRGWRCVCSSRLDRRVTGACHPAAPPPPAPTNDAGSALLMAGLLPAPVRPLSTPNTGGRHPRRLPALTPPLTTSAGRFNSRYSGLRRKRC